MSRGLRTPRLRPIGPGSEDGRLVLPRRHEDARHEVQVHNALPPAVLSMAQQFHLSVLTRLSIGTQFWVFTYALVVCFVLVCT